MFRPNLAKYGRSFGQIYVNMDFLVDLLEERDGSLFAYEFKWNKSKVKVPKGFAQAYPRHRLM